MSLRRWHSDTENLRVPEQKMEQSETVWRSSALSRTARPKCVEKCAECEKPLGTTYPICERCYHFVEDMWITDWNALLVREHLQAGSSDEVLLAEVVIDESNRHPFTVLDIAMTLQICKSCGNELGSRYQECNECALAFGSALAAEYGITLNQHALHIGRWILRHPHQHSANILIAWRLTLPRLLTDWLPTTADAQKWMDKIKAGETTEVEAALHDLDRQINAGGLTLQNAAPRGA